MSAKRFPTRGVPFHNKGTLNPLDISDLMVATNQRYARFYLYDLDQHRDRGPDSRPTGHAGIWASQADSFHLLAFERVRGSRRWCLVTEDVTRDAYVVLGQVVVQDPQHAAVAAEHMLHLLVEARARGTIEAWNGQKPLIDIRGSDAGISVLVRDPQTHD